MDIQEASLIKRMLDALTGTAGMPAGQLANVCEASPRRVNTLALHLQNIGLIDINAKGVVSLSNNVAARCIDHVFASKARFQRVSAWGAMSDALHRHKALCDKQRASLDLNKVFDHFFGAKK